MATEADILKDALAAIQPVGDEPTERARELGEALKQSDHPQPQPLPNVEEHEHVFRCLRCGATPDET